MELHTICRNLDLCPFSHGSFLVCS